MHLCDTAEVLISERRGGGDWLDELRDVADVPSSAAAGESNVIELAAFFDHANRVMVE